MNRDEMIESIIREVKRVLAERGIPVANGAAGPAAPSGTSVPAARIQASTETPSVGSTDLSGRQIITLKDIEAFSGTTITVRRNAVITPLAVDHARANGVTIEKIDAQALNRGGSTPGMPAVTAALVVAPNFTGDKNVVERILKGKGFAVKTCTGGFDAAVTSLAGTVASKEADFGVIIENSGMEGPIAANRNTAVRAVHCRTTMEARAARVDYNANVIVIDRSSSPESVISGFCGM